MRLILTFFFVFKAILLLAIEDKSIRQKMILYRDSSFLYISRDSILPKGFLGRCFYSNNNGPQYLIGYDYGQSDTIKSYYLNNQFYYEFKKDFTYYQKVSRHNKEIIFKINDTLMKRLITLNSGETVRIECLKVAFLSSHFILDQDVDIINDINSIYSINVSNFSYPRLVRCKCSPTLPYKFHNTSTKNHPDIQK
jgi:hypothetical protein